MITIERLVEIDRPVTAVFAFLSDFCRTEQWDPGTITTTRTDSGPLRVGAMFHNTSQYRGRRTELDYRVERFDPDEHLTFVGNNSTVQATDDLAFVGRPDGTTIVTYRAYFSFKKAYRLAEPFLRRGFAPIADETAAQLKRAVESAI